MQTRAVESSYLHWAKRNSQAKYNLATSGIMNYPLRSLAIPIEQLEINGANAYGYMPLREAIAHKCGTTAEHVMTTNGTSMANHLVMAAILKPGDEVLMEMPTYGLLLEVASYLGANIVRFERRMEDGFQIDVAKLESLITSKTRLIVLTNLHNPSGAITDSETLRTIGTIAARVGAQVLVDEVYLDMVNPSPQATCLHLGDNFVVTNSLTKTYGLSGLRCGWILAEEELIERIWRLNDLFNATPVHPGELMSVTALGQLDSIRARTMKILDANWQALNQFLDRVDHLELLKPIGGTVIFPKLKCGSVDEFCELLRRDYETSVVPGSYFEMPQHFRVGIGGDQEMTAAGLDRIAAALEAYGATQSGRE